MLSQWPRCHTIVNIVLMPGWMIDQRLLMLCSMEDRVQIWSRADRLTDRTSGYWAIACSCSFCPFRHGQAVAICQ